MLHVYEQIQNPLTRRTNARDRATLEGTFPDLRCTPEGHILGLRRYVRDCPEVFYDRETYDFFLHWLKQRDTTDRPALRAYLLDVDAEINSAFLFLREVNSELWHDDPLNTGDEYQLIRFIDRHVHPTYLRLVEAILFPLVRVVAHFSRIDRNKGTDGLAVWPTVEELRRGAAECLVRHYRRTVRNGIAHGGITYLQGEVRYRDKSGGEEAVPNAGVAQLTDDLLDACNGLAAALKVFFLISRCHGYQPPQQLLLEELQEETQTPWWEIERCMESQVDSRRQLLIYTRAKSRDVSKIHFSAFQSGILAEFFAPGYDRYFFSLRSPQGWPGWAAFDGKRLQALREASAGDISEYTGVIEDGLIFYVPKPALPRYFCKVDTLRQSVVLNSPLEWEKYRVERLIPQPICRSASIHRNSWGAVLHGQVVIDEFNDNDLVGVIKKHRRRIVRSALRAARRSATLTEIARYLPVGYARIAVYRRNFRRRRLSSYSLGEDLVCTVQLQRIRRIQSPDIFGSTIETDGKWRIAWNRAWLEKFPQQAFE